MCQRNFIQVDSCHLHSKTLSLHQVYRPKHCMYLTSIRDHVHTIECIKQTMFSRKTGLHWQSSFRQRSNPSCPSAPKNVTLLPVPFVSSMAPISTLLMPKQKARAVQLNEKTRAYRSGTPHRVGLSLPLTEETHATTDFFSRPVSHSRSLASRQCLAHTRHGAHNVGAQMARESHAPSHGRRVPCPHATPCVVLREAILDNLTAPSSGATEQANPPMNSHSFFGIIG